MGILRGFDRLRLQGPLRHLYSASVMEEYLSQAKVLWKDFKTFATGITARVCQNAQQLAQAAARPFAYLASSRTSKEDLARDMARREGLEEGLVAVFRCVEPCRTYHARGNYRTKKLELKLGWGKLCVVAKPIIASPGSRTSRRLSAWPMRNCAPTG